MELCGVPIKKGAKRFVFLLRIQEGDKPHQTDFNPLSNRSLAFQLKFLGLSSINSASMLEIHKEFFGAAVSNRYRVIVFCFMTTLHLHAFLQKFKKAFCHHVLCYTFQFRLSFCRSESLAQNAFQQLQVVGKKSTDFVFP